MSQLSGHGARILLPALGNAAQPGHKNVIGRSHAEVVDLAADAIVARHAIRRGCQVRMPEPGALNSRHEAVAPLMDHAPDASTATAPGRAAGVIVVNHHRGQDADGISTDKADPAVFAEDCRLAGQAESVTHQELALVPLGHSEPCRAGLPCSPMIGVLAIPVLTSPSPLACQARRGEVVSPVSLTGTGSATVLTSVSRHVLDFATAVPREADLRTESELARREIAHVSVSHVGPSSEVRPCPGGVTAPAGVPCNYRTV